MEISDYTNDTQTIRAVRDMDYQYRYQINLAQAEIAGWKRQITDLQAQLAAAQKHNEILIEANRAAHEQLAAAQGRVNYWEVRHAEYERRLNPDGEIDMRGWIADLQAQLAAANKDIESLNLVLRHAGWGQGEIDSAAVTVDKLQSKLAAAQGEINDQREEVEGFIEKVTDDVFDSLNGFAPPRGGAAEGGAR